MYVVTLLVLIYTLANLHDYLSSKVFLETIEDCLENKVKPKAYAKTEMIFHSIYILYFFAIGLKIKDQIFSYVCIAFIMAYFFNMTRIFVKAINNEIKLSFSLPGRIIVVICKVAFLIYALALLETH